MSWTDFSDLSAENASLLTRPSSVAICGDKIAAVGRASQVVHLFSLDGALVVTIARTPGQSSFRRLGKVRCDVYRERLAVVDEDRVTEWTLAGEFVRDVGTLATPQHYPASGDVAFSATGSWYDSWLGIAAETGPTLDSAGWADVSLARVHHPSGVLAGVGRPRGYRDLLARRALNRTHLVGLPTGLAILTEGDATIQMFSGGRLARRPIVLPVYFAGRRIVRRVGDIIEPESGLRRNKYVYEPNVGGLTMVGDSLFGLIRYLSWHITYVGTFPSGSIETRPVSAVEVVGFDGKPVGMWAAPGFVIDLAGGRDGVVAVISSDSKRRLHLLVGHLPFSVLRSRDTASARSGCAVPSSSPATTCILDSRN